MYSIKEKFTEKLAHLFADSPNNSAASFAADSSFEENQVRSYNKGGKSTSFFSFVVPLGSSDGSKSEQLQRDLRSSRSLPFRRMDNYEECISCCSGSESKQESPVTERKRSCPSSSGDSDIFAEANELPSQTKLLTNLTEESTFITPELYEFLQSSIPNIVKGCQWILLYSTLKHGISLRTLLRKSADLSGPCLLIVGDMRGAVFGGMLECPLKPTSKKKYQGTNQTFVFTTIYGEPRLFRPTGANRYYYMCLNDLLALGGGGSYALCLDGDLLNGTSGPCETFGNLCLAHNAEFELKNVELWGFSHVSHYLS